MEHPSSSRLYRARREPRARMGALVQLDASPFDWLEGRGPAMNLHGAIDDATGTVLALHFRPTEDLHGYTTLLAALATQYGLPLAFYGDRLNVFLRNDAHWTLEEELQGAQTPTHFGQKRGRPAIQRVCASTSFGLSEISSGMRWAGPNC